MPNTSPQTLGVLAALMAAPEAWRYGYDLSRETGLKSGTLYPVLMRLKEHGLLEAAWQESELPGRPQRHAYRLTLKGAAFARDHVARTAHRPPTGQVAGAKA